MIKKIICTLLALSLLSFSNITVYAEKITQPTTNYYQIRTVTDSGFVSGFATYDAYTQYSFGNYGNVNCVAIACCNVLAYYKQVQGYSNLYPNSTIDVSVHDTLFYGMGGSSVDFFNCYNAINSTLGSYCSSKGYSLTMQNHNNLIMKWSQFKTKINNNIPCIYAYNGHAVMVSGYKVEDGVKYLFVSNDSVGSQYAWLEYNNNGNLFSLQIS